MRNDFVDKRLFFEAVKRNWTSVLRPGLDRGKVVVYGLASGYSGSFMAVMSTMSLVLALLLGEGITSSLAQVLLVLLIVLELGTKEEGQRLLVPMWCLMAQHAFYALGHQPTFSSIPWEAAFIGLPGNFRFQSVQALPLLLNLNASHVLLAFSLPLVVVWPVFSGKIGMFSLNPHLRSERTEFDLSTRNDWILSKYWNTAVGYISLLSAKMLAVSLASAVHRRHLMVWKIFAPKFIFEGVSFLVSCCSVWITFVIVSRLNYCIKKF